MDQAGTAVAFLAPVAITRIARAPWIVPIPIVSARRGHDQGGT